MGIRRARNESEWDLGIYVTDGSDRTYACLKVCPPFDVDKDQVRCTSFQGLTFTNSCTTSKEPSARVKMSLMEIREKEA